MVALRAQPFGLGDLLGCARRAEEEDRRTGGTELRLGALEDLEAAHEREVDVQQDEIGQRAVLDVRRFNAKEFERITSVLRDLEGDIGIDALDDDACDLDVVGVCLLYTSRCV